MLSNGEGIGATGFEPATSWSQTKRSTKLSYAPGKSVTLREGIVLGKGENNQIGSTVTAVP